MDLLACSCSSVLCAAPLGCAVLHRETSAPVSLGLRPHSHLSHREKECADLMMCRKSAEPHRDPRTAIGRWCDSKPGPLWTQAPYKRHVETPYVELLWLTLRGDALCSALGCSTSRVTSAEVEEVSARQDREKLVGGTEGLSAEADCYKWLQLLLRPWSWLK